MTSSNNRKRVTVVASETGIQKAECAFVRHGYDAKSNFAKAQLISRNVVTRFFHRDPIQLDSFKRICKCLQLDWQEILELESVKSLETDVNKLEIVNQSTLSPSISRQLTVLNETNEVKATIVLEGDITSVDAAFKTALECCLAKYGGHTIKVLDIKAGSIRITIQGPQHDVERLRKHIATRELTQIDRFPIVAIEEFSAETEHPDAQTKWNLVQTIASRSLENYQLSDIDLSDVDLIGANLSRAQLLSAELLSADLRGADLLGTNLRDADLFEADLRGADLRGADLISADLQSANLRGADLRGADLRGANLRGADLRGTDLRGANLRGADLCGTDLRGADLRGADLRGAGVQNALFEDGAGLAMTLRQALARRGAIFNNAVGDRAALYSPTS